MSDNKDVEMHEPELPQNASSDHIQDNIRKLGSMISTEQTSQI